MASTEVSRFLTGFLKQQTKDINDRKDLARDYFSKQMEIAQSRGIKMKAERDQSMNANLSIAQQLVQNGVPKDLVMAYANQNPDDLKDLQSRVDDLKAEGVPVDADFFKYLGQVGGNFKAPDEDMATFFKRIYEPLKSNARSNPEGFKRDTPGSIFASMFGYNAMERANQKLQETEVFDGMSAADVLADTGQRSKPYGESTVSLDAAEEGDAIRDVRAEREQDAYDLRQSRRTPRAPKEPSIYDVTNLNKAYDAAKAEIANQMKDPRAGGDLEINTNDPEVKAKIEGLAAQKLVKMGFKPELIAKVSPNIAQALQGPTEAPTGPSTSPAMGTPANAGTASTGAPSASQGFPKVLPNGDKLIGKTKSGKPVYESSVDGHKYTTQR